MLGIVCVEAVSEREMSRDVGEGSSVRPRDPGTVQKYPTARCTLLPYNPAYEPQHHKDNMWLGLKVEVPLMQPSVPYD